MSRPAPKSHGEIITNRTVRMPIPSSSLRASFRATCASILAGLLFLFFPLAAMAEYLYCDVNITGLSKSDFTIIFTDTDSGAAQSTTAVTVSELPAAGGTYKFAAFTDSTTTNYYVRIEYPAGTTICEYYYPFGGAAVAVAWTSDITLNLNTNVWAINDRLPSLSLEVASWGADPTGATVKFYLRNTTTNAYKVNGSTGSIGSISQAADGTYSFTLTYSWASGDLDMSDYASGVWTGRYVGHFTMDTGSAQGTFPTDDSLRVTVMRK